MSKNRKRLAKLLIPMLALSAINTNAVVNVKSTVRNKSMRKMNYKEDGYKEHASMKRILLKSMKLQNMGKQGVFWYEGTALQQLKENYELVGEFKGIDRLGIDGVINPRGTAGHAGSVAKYRRKKDGKIFAVKYEPNPERTKIITANNNEFHMGDNKREANFYRDAETLWKDKKWATKVYDKYWDDYGTYTVTDWIEGKTFRKWLKDLKGKSEDKIQKIVAVMKQYQQIIDDLRSKNKTNPDLNPDNVMVTPEGILKVVDHGWYYDRNEKDDIVKDEDIWIGKRYDAIFECIEDSLIKNRIGYEVLGGQMKSRANKEDYVRNYARGYRGKYLDSYILYTLAKMRRELNISMYDGFYRQIFKVDYNERYKYNDNAGKKIIQHLENLADDTKL